MPNSSKSEFLTLQIQDQEIQRASNVYSRNPLEGISDKDIAIFSTIYSIILGVYISVFLFDIDDIFVVIIVTIITIILLFALGQNVLRRQRKKLKGYSGKYKHLKILYKQVQKFNLLLETIDGIHEAEVSSGVKTLKNKQEIMKALISVRADLICAFKLDKASRENTDFNINDFTVDLENFKLLDTSQETTEDSRLINEAFEIATSVQEEMNLIQSLSR